MGRRRLHSLHLKPKPEPKQLLQPHLPVFLFPSPFLLAVDPVNWIAEWDYHIHQCTDD